MTFSDDALYTIAQEYCSDGGVREMMGNLTKLIRKIITGWSTGSLEKPYVVDSDYIYNNLKKTATKVNNHTIGYL